MLDWLFFCCPHEGPKNCGMGGVILSKHLGMPLNAETERHFGVPKPFDHSIFGGRNRDQKWTGALHGLMMK